jgi:hypothetical protein
MSAEIYNVIDGFYYTPIDGFLNIFFEEFFNASCAGENKTFSLQASFPVNRAI